MRGQTLWSHLVPLGPSQQICHAVMRIGVPCGIVFRVLRARAHMTATHGLLVSWQQMYVWWRQKHVV